MRCDHAERLLSDRLDDPLEPRDDAALERHVADCAACRGYARRLEELRRRMRVGASPGGPDVAARVRRLLRGRRRAPASAPWAAAAVFVLAFALAAAAVGLGAPRPAEALDVPELVTVGQHRVEALHAEVTVTEHGWHPEVPVRTYEGTLAYAAPETFELVLTDRTTYPDDRWVANDITLGIDEDRSWRGGLRRCPLAALPGCTPEEPLRRVTTAREPFDPADPSPLDLVVPVASLSPGGIDRDLGTRVTDGRREVGLEVAAGQIAPMLDAMTAVGNWRPWHPTDRATLWVDAATGVPHELALHAADSPERVRWAAALGHDEPAGAVILTWRLDDVELAPGRAPALSPPAAPAPVDRGFRDAEARLVPGWLPDGMSPYRSGHVGDVEVATFSDGRAWIAVRSTTRWDADRLFGGTVGPVQRLAVGDGVGYASGDRILLHGTRDDVEVTGSVPREDLRRVAASLGVTGRPVPADWAEAGATTLEAAVAAMPDLLVPEDPEGFHGPAVAVTDHAVSLGYVGGGARSFVVTQRPGDTLRPPLEDVVIGVEVDGHPGRFTPDRGELEWVADGTMVVLTSETLSLVELLDVAHGLRPATP